MAHHTQLCIVLFGTCLFSILLLLECRKLKGYEFPVYSTKECPGNQAEWKNRSSAINCTEKKGYMCTPNENLTDLLEFCYIYPRILVKEGLCLYLAKRVSRVNSYNCRKFTHGCPELNYFSSETYVHLSCMEIENGCFSAEPSCKRQPLQRKTSIDDTTLAIILGVSIPACILCILVFYVVRKKFGICKRRSHTVRNDEETELLLCGYESMDNNKEYPIEEVIFGQWKQDDGDFISTNACKKVENMIKSWNLVVVSGHSGSGKSAIIQHIALKYRKEGWNVRRVNMVEDIVIEYNSSQFRKHKTILVFNNPFGKECFDEIFNDSWQTYEEDLKVYLRTTKLLMSCRSHIISDARVARHLVNQAAIVDIDDEKYKFSVGEKRQYLTKFTSDMNLPQKDCNEIVKVERYFPLLCKLFSSKEYKNKSMQFFTEPITVLKKEIIGLKENDRGKYMYCALALLVFFNDDLCVSDLLRNEDTENKFKHTLKLCGLPKNTALSAIEETLKSLKGFFVKSIGNTYHFYHDLVMEVTTHVFGTDYPTETIQYADIGFLRRRVRLEDCNEHTDSSTIYLSDNYIDKLGERLFNEMFGNRLIDVVLNPCLKTKKMIEALNKIIQKHPEQLPKLLEKKKLELYVKKKCHFTSRSTMSKLAFMGLNTEITPLFVIIVLGHADFSHKCLETLQQMDADFTHGSILSAVYCNGSMKLFDLFSKDCVQESLKNNLGGFYPIHIVCLFHNYEILEKLIKIGVRVNLGSQTLYPWTPLLLASCNDVQEYGDESHRKLGATQRDKTVQILLSYGADINLCQFETSPLYLACQNGYDSTAELLLKNKANINSCKENGASPLYIACKNGHDSTVQLLLKKNANINSCKENGASPLYIACKNGHDSTVQLLLKNNASINSCNKKGASPLYIACKNGHDSTVRRLLQYVAINKLSIEYVPSILYTACQNGKDCIVQLLLNNGADINFRQWDGASPLFTACENGHDSTVQMLLNNEADINLCQWHGTSPLCSACENGHKSTVELLLSNEADINLCQIDGTSPLYKASENGHDDIVQLLLNKGADMYLCKEDGASALHSACQNGHDSIVQTLLNNGADINLRKTNGTSPLHIASENGHDNIVEILLNNGADVKLCRNNGASALHTASQNGHDSIVQTLHRNRADINLRKKNGTCPLYIACKNGHNNSVQYLLEKGAHVNLCKKNGASPLYTACQNGYDSTVNLLLLKNAKIDLCKKNGKSPLYVACENNHISTVQLLLKNLAKINLCMEDGATPLYIACKNGYKSIIQQLLSNRASINLCQKNGASPLYIACENGHDSTVKLLLNNEANIFLCTKSGTSPLYIACKNGQDSIAQLLLSKGADINFCKKNGASPLYKACENGLDSTFQLLLSKGANINLCNTNGASPLFIACQNGHEGIVQHCLRNGAIIDLCNKTDACPLLIACQNGHECIVQHLVRNGAHINLCNKTGASPLLKACKNGYESIVQHLVRNGADINLCNEKGASPLLKACKNGHENIVQLLVTNGANINLCKKHGASPLYVACQNGQEPIVRLLLKKGADFNLCKKPNGSPLFVACQKGYDIIAQLLLRKGAK